MIHHRNIRRTGPRCAAALLAILAAGCNFGGGSGTRETNAGQQKSGALGGMIKGGGNQQAASEPGTGDASADAGPPAAPASGGAGGKPDGGGSPAATVSRDNFDRRVRIVNNSSRVITLVQGSPASQPDWGADRIPTMTLAAGQATVVDFNDNNGECRYDLRVTFDDQNTAEQRNVDICRISEWRAAPGGGRVR